MKTFRSKTINGDTTLEGIYNFLMLLLLIQIPVESLDEYIVSTDDDIDLIFRGDGTIESLKIDDIELLSKPDRVLYMRDLTPEYNIENLVYNPSFEIDDDNDGIADGWTPKILQGNMDISLDNQNVYDGYKSLRMTFSSNDESYQMAYISNYINISRGEDYCISN